ncbi:MAG: hypothetical protein VE99_C0001G0013 [candidate division Kazan bacterium GW2011_GWC1_52_13]|nr:MAG: hypothetical protein VE99_C0001G0013 [candidate division Kazan bacterium GW2011_GWC1_52_13]KKW26683.1 MAG: hypothetical protein VF00_C0002G0008 [candidate division Kazan bacterium GW2011_GWB1_52_7]
MPKGTKRYYYIKPKTASGVGFREPGLSPAVRTRKVARSTLDMSFGEAAVSAPALSWLWMGLRLAILAVLAIALYVGGGLVSQAAGSVQGQITELAGRGMSKLEAASAAVLAQDVSAARDNFIAAENLFGTAQKQLLGLGQTNLYLSGLGSDTSKVVAGQKLIDSGYNLAQAGRTLVDTLTPTWQYFNGLESANDQPQQLATQIVGLMGKSSQNLDRVLTQVSRANLLLASVNPALVDPAYATALADAQTKTATLQATVMTLATLAKELPGALGFNNPRQYLILNQNNNELRATGGFVGSYMLVEVYKGQLKSVLVDMTQRIDGQNPNTSLPLPAPLTTITSSFGTRDANWYLDFPTSAQTFQKLYEEAGGGTADGIIAIDPEAIKDLLTIFGPTYLAGKDLTLTADNFVTATQAQIELIDKDKANPKEVLNEFAPILLGRLLNANGEEMKRISSALLARLGSKDVMLYMRSPKMQSVMEQLQVAGTVPVDTGGDFLAVVRSNLGGRKSSQVVAEEIHHTANVNLTGDVTVSVELKYTHTGVNVFPDGPNKDYIRIYVPQGSLRISVDGEDYGTEVDQIEEGDKTIFGLWLTTQPGASQTVTVNYRLPHKVTSHYQLDVMKQPGANNTTLVSVLKLSPALGIADEAGTKTKPLFNGELNADLSVGVDIIQVN